ncbi:MAG: DUF333 domain-containing protein [Deltaproteobacteria bacterium]|nr:DUF333 domain-containing protein [Deltaproteobacteria bacterium]
MRLALLLLLLASSQAALAADGCKDHRVFKIEGVDQDLCFVESSGSWVSRACVEQTGAGSCEAQALLKKAPQVARLSEKERQGGKNPGSVLCAKLNGTVAYAKLESGSEITFCEASDHSVVDCNALHQAWSSRHRR